MTEEHITKSIISHLKSTGWIIHSFDYPQSGTGMVLHPNYSKSKVAGIIIPDIIAYYRDDCLFFENKVNYSKKDCQKLAALKSTDMYSNALNKLFAEIGHKRINIGIGLSKSKRNIDKIKATEFIDKKLVVGDDGDIVIVS